MFYLYLLLHLIKNTILTTSSTISIITKAVSTPKAISLPKSSISSAVQPPDNSDAEALESERKHVHHNRSFYCNLQPNGIKVSLECNYKPYNEG